MNRSRASRTRLLGTALAALVGLLAVGSVAAPAGAVPPDPPPPMSTAAFCAGIATGDPFTDVDNTSAHYDNIRCLVESGITKGTTSTTYTPRGTVTRDQMASFVARLIDTANEREIADLEDLPAYDGSPDFDDVPSNNTHFTSIMRLSQAGVVNGTGPRTYTPGGSVNREQMAAFINRTAQFLTGEKYATTNDYFTDDENSTFEADINGIASRGIAVGDRRDTYNPGAKVTREQMASFLIRTLAVLHDDDQIEALKDTPEAPDGTINGTGATSQSDTNKGAQVETTNKAADSFEACDITALAAEQDTVNNDRCFTYEYDSDDTFRIGGDSATLAEFEAQLSPFDDITGTYSRTGASTFNLVNEAPAAPEGVTAAAEGRVVTLTIDDSSTPSVDAYNVYRADARGVPGLECQEPGLDFTLIGSATDPSPTADSGNATFPDTTVTPESAYCYKVFSSDDGDESSGSVTTGLVETPAAAVSSPGAPYTTSVSLTDGGFPNSNEDEIEAGDDITLVFNETMAAPGSGDTFLAQDDDGTIGQITCSTTRATCEGSGNRIDITLLQDPVILADTNTAQGDNDTLSAGAVIIDQDGYVDTTGEPWNLRRTGSDLTIDDDDLDPLSVDVRVTTNTSLPTFLSAGDVIKLAFNEDMDAPGNGDSFSVTGANGITATVTCGPLGNATCSRNASAETFGGQSYPANRVITVTMDGTTGASYPATITGQSGYTDADGANNSWRVCSTFDEDGEVVVPGSPDRTINSVQDKTDHETPCP